MSVKLKIKTIENENFKVNCIHFIPPTIKHTALFTHGYTASKTDCISWASRLSDNQVACTIFDLPGHYLGSINQVSSFDVFAQNAHHLFELAYHDLLSEIDSKPDNIFLGGHSLGALLALKASELDVFKQNKISCVAVGLGKNLNMDGHLFNTEFYQKTLNIRAQLVDPNIGPKVVFPWISNEKDKLSLKNTKIHLITGLDDVVVGAGGMKHLADKLSEHNQVTYTEPNKLPHHEPSLASPHIYSFFKRCQQT